MIDSVGIAGNCKENKKKLKDLNQEENLDCAEVDLEEALAAGEVNNRGKNKF